MTIISLHDTLETAYHLAKESVPDKCSTQERDNYSAILHVIHISMQIYARKRVLRFGNISLCSLIARLGIIEDLLYKLIPNVKLLEDCLELYAESLHNAYKYGKQEEVEE